VRRACRRVAWAGWAAWITEPPAALALKKGHRLFSNSEEAMADAGIRGEAMVVTDCADDQTLARDMIEVHGREAATVARENARAAALAGQAARAKQWIRVLGFVQRQLAGKGSPIRASS
jgi:hypothetical protein